jgi:hypothetical protein
MPNNLKKQGFSIGMDRLFTRPERDAYDWIHFKEPEQSGEAGESTFEYPDNWSAEAAALLADSAAQPAIPEHTKPVEENTVPSWLWRHVGQAGGKSETSAKDIFDRVVGSAVYSGWKQAVFSDETSARAFYDEARYALAQRFIAIEPHRLAKLGLAWAYGLEEIPAAWHAAPAVAHAPVEISNDLIDAIISGSRDKAVCAKWQKITAAKTKTYLASLRFTDITGDWGLQPAQGMEAVLDLMCFRHNDGSVNIEALRHAARLLVIMLDLHAQNETLAIGFCNLAPLLMALALPFDSEAARAMAAAISAILTAETYATSAELAALRGMSPAFSASRETVLRALRNRRRAAYGDPNDYEKMSVLPAPLKLEACPDLALAAAARAAWDRTLELVHSHGLRHTQVTTLSASPTLTLFMESATQGIEAMHKLTVTRPAESDLFRQDIHPSVTEGLMRLGYNLAQSQAIIRHIAGARRLDKAPAINPVSLRARRFSADAIKRVENYLPYVNHIRLAFTPWIIGEEFCRRVLRIPPAKIKNPRFDMLTYLGFSAEDIAAANTRYYGTDGVKGAPGMQPQHAASFARDGEISPEARIRVAASVQSFITGDAGLELSLPRDMPIEKTEKLLLGAWRQGVTSVAIDYAGKTQEKDAAAEKETAHKMRRTAFMHTKAPALPTRRARLKAKAGLVSGAGRGKSKTLRRNRSW